MLGVQPSAGHEGIRKAYVARALALHPDRVAHEGSEAVAAAEFRMRELNVAWEVLRDPQRRSDYDRTLRSSTQSGEDVAPGATRNTTTDLPEPIPDAPRSSAPHAAGWWLVPLAAAVVLVVAALLTGLAAQREGQQVLEVQTGDRFAPGMCVAVRPGLDAQLVPCDDPSSGRIVEVVPHPRPCRNGDLHAVVLRSERLTLCLEPVPATPRSP